LALRRSGGLASLILVILTMPETMPVADF